MREHSFFKLNINFRSLVIMLMACVMMSFSSAETRAAVQTKIAEENGGIARFYEDKVTHHHVEVVRVAQMQTMREPEDTIRLIARLPLLASPVPNCRERHTASPRAPPHCPRAPPVAC